MSHLVYRIQQQMRTNISQCNQTDDIINFLPMNYELINKQYSYKQQNPAYSGEPFDKQLAEGPNQYRKCRDCLCVLLYAALWAAMIIIASYAFKQGNPQLLTAPFDSTGRQCGMNQLRDYPLAYYNVRNVSEFGCIGKCPVDGTQSLQIMLGGQVYNNSRFQAYQTMQVVSICLPVSQEISRSITSGLGYLERNINDLKATWQISLISILAALVLSVILLAFIQTCGTCIVLLVIVVYLGGLVAVGVGCFLMANQTIQGFEQWNNPEMLRAAAYICWTAATLSLLGLCCNLNKIRVASAVIKSAAEFTRQQCKVIMVPLLMFLAISAFFVFWIATSIYIFSSGTVKPCLRSPYACVEWDAGMRRNLSLLLFGLFWNCEVAIAVCQFVIASTAAYWYFSKSRQVESSVCVSFCRAVTYQLGSLVLGALVLCVVWILQILLGIFHHLAKTQTLSSNPAGNVCFDYCMRCTRCCLACFQRFIRFLTKNAFLMMAITGEGFCSSAHQAFYLAMRSSTQHRIVQGVGDSLMLFCKLLVSVVVTLFAYVLAISLQQFKDEIYSAVTPALMSLVISYVVGSLFMDVLGVAADTIVMCYSLEMDVRKGSAVVIPEQLKEIIVAK